MLALALSVAVAFPVKIGAQASTPAAPPPASSSKAVKDSLPAVVFKHLGCAPVGGVCRASYAMTLRNGDRFIIRIDSTLPEQYTYDVAGLPLTPTGKAVAEAAQHYVSKVVVQQHDRKYGGYLVAIRKSDPMAALPEATLVVSVTTQQWNVAFGGGFPVSSLTDRAFGLRDTTVGSATRYRVEREKDHEDKVNLATATFIHAYNTRHPTLGLSFGLGVGGGGKTSYFVGPSYMLGEMGALTVGATFGSRKTLPDGVREGDLTTNANALANLKSVNAPGLFAALSYSFLGGGKADLDKPLKGAAGEGGTQATETTPPKAATGNDTTASQTSGKVNPGQVPVTARTRSVFQLVLRAARGQTLKPGLYDLATPDTAVTLTSPKIQLEDRTAAKDGTQLTGDFEATLKATDGGTHTFQFTISGQGIKPLTLTAADVAVKP